MSRGNLRRVADANTLILIERVPFYESLNKRVVDGWRRKREELAITRCNLGRRTIVPHIVSVLGWRFVNGVVRSGLGR